MSLQVRPLEIWEFAERIGYRVNGKVYDIANVPMLREPFRAARDWRTRRLVMPFPVQLGKTIFMQVAILYGMCEYPRDTMWLGQDDTNTLEFSTTRMQKDIERYASRFLSRNRYDTKNNHVIFRNGTWLAMMSGDNRKNIQSRTAQRVWNDEASILSTGRLEEAERRGEAYQLFDQFHGVISTPEDEGTEFHSYWEDSTQEIWSMACKSCGHIQGIRLDAFRWDENDLTRPDGQWDFDEVAKTIRVQCMCGKQTPIADRKGFSEILSSGQYVVTNPSAPRAHRGFTCSGLSNPRRSPAILITRFLKATQTAKKGIIAPLREVIRKDFGEFWDPGLHATEGEPVQTGGYQLGDTDWDEEHVLGPDHRCRNMTVDKQSGYYVVVIRMWAKEGHSRLLYTDQVNDWEGLAKLQEKFGIWPGIKTSRHWVAGRVYVDSAWQGEHRAGMKSDFDVFRKCAKYNWHAIQASPSKEQWAVKVRGRVVQRPWSEIKTHRPVGGVHCRGLHFGVTTISQHLSKLMAQETDVRWETPDNAPEWYLKQIRNKVLIDGKYEGRNDHAWDCEKFQLPQTYIDGLFPVSID